MLRAIKKLWNENKWTFFLFLIPFIMYWILKHYKNILIKFAEDAYLRTVEKSKQIDNNINKIEEQIKTEVDKAIELEEKIRAREANKELNLDWHKKDGK